MIIRSTVTPLTTHPAQYLHLFTSTKDDLRSLFDILAFWKYSCFSIAAGLNEMGEPGGEMKVDPARAEALISQLTSVQSRINAVAGGRNVGQRSLPLKALTYT